MNRTIICVSGYKLMEYEGMGYCVMEYHDGFWQQISRWYVYQGHAKNKLLKILKEKKRHGKN